MKREETTMKILIINGYEKHVDSNGILTKTLFDTYLNELRQKNDVQISWVESYDRVQEQNKFLWADLVIIQFPIYWFQVPGKLKLYMDDVFGFYEFYGSGKRYGQNGLMNSTKYLLSTTWNAPKYAFNDEKEFFGGKDVDDVLFPMYCAFKYCGFKPFDENRRTLSFHDVIKNPKVDEYINEIKTFVKKHNL